MFKNIFNTRVVLLGWVVLTLILCRVFPRIASAEPATRPTSPVGVPVAIPFRVTDTNHILVRVKINGQGPFNFIMDTGAPTMYVRVPVGKKIGLKPTTHGSATLDTLEIEGGAKLTDVKCVVETPYQIEGMNAIGASGVELDGLLGYSVLARFRLQIDLSKDRMMWTPLDFIPPPLVSGRPGPGKAESSVDKDEAKLEATGGLLKLLGPLVKPPVIAPKYRGLLGIELTQTTGGVLVLRVLGDTPAEKAGVHVGDELISIGASRVKLISDAQLAVQNVIGGRPVNIVVRRDQTEIKFKIASGEGL